MRAAAYALDHPRPDIVEPSIISARAVAATIAEHGSLNRDTLLGEMERAHGASSTDGRWSLRDAYDVLELAQVFHLETAALPQAPASCVAALVDMVAALPTHSVRSEHQIELQQFSTPAPIAYLAALAARIGREDLVLEPSAGTGLLAAFARRAGARLVLNELDPARAAMLRAAFPDTIVTTHDAELIHDLLPPEIRPTAVLVNPPFSRSLGRHADPLAALRHVRAALALLVPNGRCVAILPDRIHLSSRAWAKATAGYGVTLQLLLPANAYVKHGTAQQVRLVVLQRGATFRCNPIACETLEAAAELASGRPIVVGAAPPPTPAPPSPANHLERPRSLLGGLTRASPSLRARLARDPLGRHTRRRLRRAGRPAASGRPAVRDCSTPATISRAITPRRRWRRGSGCSPTASYSRSISATSSSSA